MSAADAAKLQVGDEVQSKRFSQNKSKVIAIVVDIFGPLVILRGADKIAFCLELNQFGSFKKC